jgi:hypothetical protein
MTASLPRTSILAVVGGTTAGVAGLALAEPAVLLGVLAGLFLGIGIAGFDGSFRRIVLASALLPAGVLGGVAPLGVDLLATLAVAVGVGVVAVTTETLSETAIDRARSGTLTATAVTATLTGFFGLAAVAGGIESLLSGLDTLQSGGQGSVLVNIAVASLLGAIAIVAIPAAAFTSPDGRERSVAVRNFVAVLPLVLGAVVYGAVQLLQLSRPGMVELAPVRRATTLVALAALALIVFFGLVRWSWGGTEGDENAVVGVTVGAACGLAVVAALAATFGVPGEGDVSLAVLFTTTTAGLVVLWVFLTRFHARVTSRMGGASTGIATVLVAGALVVGVRAGESASVTNRPGIAVFLALAAGLFTYNVGRYGRTLGREIGPRGATALPQFVRTVWSGTVATFGVAVGICGAWVTALVAPALTTAATIGVVGGLVAAVVGTVLLLR